MKYLQSIFTAVISVFFFLQVAAQDVYTKAPADKKTEKKAAKWAKRGTWRQGFTAAAPHASVNLSEFYTQYQRNTAQWQAMFRWLATHDLLAIPAGKHPIDGTSLVVSVEDSENGPLAKRRSESHYHHIDFQYVVRGTERFGIIEHNSSKPNSKYKPDVMHYDYDLSKAVFHDSTPDAFFLFFPDDWHIAKVQTEKADQHIRVIVVKLDYVE